MSAPQRRRSALDRADTWLLVVVGVIAALVVLQVVSWVVHAVLWVAKLAAIVAVLFLVVTLVLRRREGD